jgi:mannose-6-phosphate isomerase-like protein (cupin superfamily)
MDVVSRNSVKEFVTKDGSLVREILAPANSSLERQSLAEATLGPGQSTERHHHVKTEEIYYILEGEGTMEVGEDSGEVKRGDAIAIPPGSSHQLTNTGAADMVLLCCCSPAYTHEDTVMAERQA